MRLSYIFNALGLVLFCIGIMTLLPIFVALYYGEYQEIVPFLITGGLSVCIGGILKSYVHRFLSKDEMSDIKKSEALFIVILAWFIFAIIASIPFLFFGIRVEDAFFEGVSGATSTGASILTSFDYPKVFFFWRALIQWIGGMGILILFIAILPQFAVAGRQMFFTEAPGPTEDKLTPRIRHTATALWGVYVILTFIQIILLICFGMNPFDAVCNSLSTLSSGGFSPNSNSIAGYNSQIINWIFIVFMFLAGTNLALVYKSVTKFNPLLIFKNEEFRIYLKIILTLSVLISVSLYFNQGNINFKDITNVIFSIISVITSAGFVSTDYSDWCIGAQILLFTVVFFGSCAGSTGGGIKIIRVIILLKYFKKEVIKLLHPNAVINIKVDNSNISKDVVSQIIAFSGFYFLFILISSIVVSIIENNYVVGFTGSIATMNIIGPALGSIIGPTGTYESLEPLTKVIFMFNMLIGRLELIPFLIMLNADFWSFKK